jgi:hypothetical protein
MVDGVRLLEGHGGRRDETAIAAAWRFRYEPALDDDGNPIRSHVTQRFQID